MLTRFCSSETRVNGDIIDNYTLRTVFCNAIEANICSTVSYFRFARFLFLGVFTLKIDYIRG